MDAGVKYAGWDLLRFRDLGVEGAAGESMPQLRMRRRVRQLDALLHRARKSGDPAAAVELRELVRRRLRYWGAAEPST